MSLTETAPAHPGSAHRGPSPTNISLDGHPISATSKDTRRGMAAAVGLLNVLGEALDAQQAGHTKD
jgi:hypothetical protein